MPVACRNRNQTATNPLHLCKTVDKVKRIEGIFIWFSRKYHKDMGNGKLVCLYVSVNSPKKHSVGSTFNQHQNVNCGILTFILPQWQSACTVVATCLVLEEMNFDCVFWRFIQEKVFSSNFSMMCKPKCRHSVWDNKCL